jgi:hypothetical protein
MYSSEELFMPPAAPRNDETLSPFSSPLASRSGNALPLDALLKDGFIAGIVGALTVALWFLIVDTIAGRPLYTPTLLGTVFFHHGADFPSPAPRTVSLDMVFKYSVFHWVAFAVMGVMASFGLRLAAREPHLGFGILLFFSLFVVFEFGFRLARATLFSSQVDLPWLKVLIGNLLASAAIGVYLLRRHRHMETT